MLQSSPSVSLSASADEAQDTDQNNLAPPILLQYWQVVLRWKWVIVSIVMATSVIGVVATLLITPQYTAKSRIEISREQKNVTNVEGLESADAARNLEFYQTQYNLLQARSLAERVAKQLQLSQNNEFFEAHGVDIQDNALFAAKTNAQLTAADRLKREKLATGLLLQNANIAPIRNSALVDIEYASASNRKYLDRAIYITKHEPQILVDGRCTKVSRRPAGRPSYPA